MDNRTLLAIVLSVVVVAGSFLVSNIFFPNKPVPAPTAAAPAPSSVPAPAPASPKALEAPAAAPTQPEIAPRTVVVENNVMRVTFSNEGAVATSIELKKQLEQGRPVEMINKDRGSGAAFETSLGGFETQPAVHETFEVTQLSPLSYKFSRVLTDVNGAPYTLSKTFTLQPNEYLIKVEVGVASSTGGLPALASGAEAYTLSYGPQLGPHFTALNGNQDFRKYYKFNGSDRSEEGLNHETKSTDASLKWAAISGKYFSVIGVPDSTAYKTVFSNKATAADAAVSGAEVSRLAFVRPALKSSTTVDTFYFYVGPKEEAVLNKYDSSTDNAFGLSSLKLQRAMEEPFLWGWFGLESLLKVIMLGVTLLVPNWGIAIIILTVLIKLATWPLTAKSYRANAAMQTLQPKMKELQAKYKDDPKKLNEQTMALYQKEGVNPLGGCLPMLLQIPVFFSLYNLFSTQFDLRGASFIPGWIFDLSQPDYLLHFNYTVPLIGFAMTGLHLLPLVMVGTQIWTSLLSQPASGSTGQMKIMTYGLPFIFFFTLYEMPSGRYQDFEVRNA